MDYIQTYKNLYHITSLNGECTVSVDKMEYVDDSERAMCLHHAVYTVGPIKLKCMVKENTQIEPVTFFAYCILKNFRHKNVVSVENFYFDEHGEGRIVVSWVDQTLRGWLEACAGNRKAFDFTHMHCQPSKAFRKMIIDLCAAVDSMFSNGVYPKGILLDDIYLVKSNASLTLKVLVSEVVDLRHADDNTKMTHVEFISENLRDVVADCCQIAAKRPVHPDTQRFFRYIRIGNSKKLENYPDIWNDQEKISYLFFIMSKPKSHVQGRVNGIHNFAWPEDNLGMLPLVIRDLKAHQERRTRSTYNIQEPYDYLLLCRNVLKHWASLPNYLKVNCTDVSAFLRKMEKWSPRIWCDLYEALQA